MTLLETLFGGLILVALLHFGLKLFGVSNYWRGVISGILPVMAYITYSMLYWPGGEVVSMHVAVFAATATVLTLLGSRKENNGVPLHWIPKLITGLFVLLFIVMANLMYISSRGVSPVVASWLLPVPKTKAHSAVHTAFPGVVAHEEDAAAAVNQHLKQLDRQRQLGWVAVLEGLAQVKQNQENTVTVTLTDKQSSPIEGANVTLSLLRPATARDDQNSIAMLPSGAGVYRSTINLKDAGRWVAVLDVEKDGDKYQLQQNIVVSKPE